LKENWSSDIANYTTLTTASLKNSFLRKQKTVWQRCFLVAEQKAVKSTVTLDRLFVGNENATLPVFFASAKNWFLNRPLLK
jgi:hypothetical protein